ncbi:ABC transporter substrate-binding protein [Rhodococcoides fascians]|uniref:ABC transporter substrate-binding protein n=1 Tax=Rhodococcoides fascians TaxID=1828 RepID=UPI000B9A4FC3|nr:ABC transporter substrate-binding protein [Rhodococcus fascians]OZE94068.1 ABC transporter substrate-binding protein [Rhodococcus fascians]OZF24506.1 ABC transporter substrate-binding protein [Rhodococcus fascians]OZF25416.1 ABC transporter substrate-binding protein [Rhodococcus fascians]OZF73426.1 ABC transporter substrate-binding protein [Rhodococcus fascians]OZF74266.1 ABC transporter substrate-binding protein [Rhodococcus fascians]
MRTRPLRRTLAVCAIALTTAGLLSACSNSDGASDGPDSPTTASSGVFPVSVEHAFGETVVPDEPTRVVVAGYTEQDTVLALGVIPVGVTEWYGDQPYATWPWARAALGNAQPEVLTNNGDGFETEKIAALEPDLIIATNAGLTADSYRTLSNIAPTLAQSDASTAYFEPWDVQAEKIGRAMGKKAEVDGLIDGVNQKFADAAAAHPEFAGKKAIFLQNAFYEGKAIAYQDGLSTDFLTKLGFVIPDDIDAFVPADGSAQASIPLENLSVLDTADVLIWGTENPGDRGQLEKEPVYNALQPVKDGNLVFTDGVTAGAIYFTSVLSLPYVIDKVAPAMSEALGGTATTITS